MKNILVLLQSTSAVMKLEKGIRAKDIECRIIPVPRQYSSECGVCVKLADCELDRVKKIADDLNLIVEIIQLPEETNV